MIKKILVPTDGSPAAERAQRYAISLAREYGAVLTGLHVIDVRLLEGPFLRDIASSLGTAPYVEYQSNITIILEERAKALLEAFEGAAEAAGVSCETSSLTGAVASTIASKSELHDLMVLGKRGEHEAWVEDLLGSTAESVVRRAHCPVLVTEFEEAKIEKALVAFDGSSHANHALQLAVSLQETWKVSLRVLVVGAEKAASVLEEAKTYVEAHKGTAEFVLKDGDASEVILQESRDSHADLILMGAYGHTRVRELIVGSTTTFVTTHAPCPVLLTR